MNPGALVFLTIMSIVVYSMLGALVAGIWTKVLGGDLGGDRPQFDRLQLFAAILFWPLILAVVAVAVLCQVCQSIYVAML